MKKIIFLLVIINVSIVHAQNYWKKTTSKKSAILKSKRSSEIENQLDYYTIDLVSFKVDLSTKKEIILPNFNGEFLNYHITEVSNFTEKVSNKYGSIKSYTLSGIDDKTANGRLSLGNDGVHVTLFSGKQKTLYIDPFQKEKLTYVVHEKGALDNNDENFSCLVEENALKGKSSTTTAESKTANDGLLRVYKLALACTGEYAEFHINQQGVANNASDTEKRAAVLSAMNTTITRINAVFERDLGVRFNIVLHEGVNELIFLDPENDNLSNDDTSSLLEESQVVCDDVIGSSNYDIGHTFSTGAGGLAGLGVICSNRSKGKGVTGISSPIGDSFDIGFVAHEIGHQFGAEHTFNGSSDFNCDNANRSKITPVEPGSGSTIMSYVGICPSINIQNEADDYFHAVSIANMQAVIERTFCAAETGIQNSAPIINISNNFSVPKSTPLILKGEASDTDSDNLTYCWEQLDTELVLEVLSTNLAGPVFRSLPPSNSPNRYLPTLETIIGGSLSNTWEVIPEVAREMNFSLTVRDNEIGGGTTAREDIVVSVIDTEPFTVNTPGILTVNTNQTITWNVGDTNVSPINAVKVDIKLSVDGGKSFPFTIVEGTDNDGTEEVLIPLVATTTNAIILIEASDNIFYNISTPFQITNSNEISLTNSTDDVFICTDDEVSYTLNYTPLNGFSETINFSVTDKPRGADITVNPTSLSEAGMITVRVTNLSSLLNGVYSLRLTADSPSIVDVIELPFEKISEYCTSIGNTGDQTSITQVDFNTISNSSIKSTIGYTDFRAITTTINRGDVHNLNVQVDSDGFFLTETIAWIDWNQNCVFDDSEEYKLGEAINVINKKTDNSPLPITVPEDAVFGNTTMRILIKYTGDGSEIVSSCENNFLGETEDYTLIVNDPTASIDNTAFNNFNLYPNPSEGIFNLNFEVFSQVDKTIIQLFDVSGRIVNKREYSTNTNVFSEQLNFNDLNSGLYLLQITNGSKQVTSKIVIE